MTGFLLEALEWYFSRCPAGPQLESVFAEAPPEARDNPDANTPNPDSAETEPPGFAEARRILAANPQFVNPKFWQHVEDAVLNPVRDAMVDARQSART